jgi:hypothetical protein
MKLACALSLALALAVHANAQAPAEQATPKPDVAVAVHLKAMKLIEMSGGRERIVAGMPAMIEQGTAAMQKQCPDCNPAFFTEWGKRMSARLQVDDLLNVAILAYEKRFTSDELNEFLAVVNSKKTGKPVALSPALQEKLSGVMPAILGEITGRCAEIGAKLGSEVGAEIGKEHPEYFPVGPKADRP